MKTFKNKSILYTEEGEKLLKNFFLQFKQLRFHEKEFIYRPDEVIENIYFIEEGHVGQQTFLLNGERFTINIFHPGSYVPMSIAMGKIENDYWFEAMTPLVVRKAPFNQVVEFLKENQLAMQELLSRFSLGLNFFTIRTEMLAFKKAREKIVTTLYWSAHQYGKKVAGNLVIDFPLTHSRLASLAGVTRETASKIMMELKKAKILTYARKKITIFDLDKLK